MFDVIEVNLSSKAVRIMARDKDLRNAEAIVDMAVARRGVEEHFFTLALAGRFQDGDTYQADEKRQEDGGAP